jgi:hypothetical protein
LNRQWELFSGARHTETGMKLSYRGLTQV